MRKKFKLFGKIFSQNAFLGQIFSLLAGASLGALAIKQGFKPEYGAEGALIAVAVIATYLQAARSMDSGREQALLLTLTFGAAFALGILGGELFAMSIFESEPLNPALAGLWLAVTAINMAYWMAGPMSRIYQMNMVATYRAAQLPAALTELLICLTTNGNPGLADNIFTSLTGWKKDSIFKNKLSKWKKKKLPSLWDRVKTRVKELTEDGCTIASVLEAAKEEIKGWDNFLARQILFLGKTGVKTSPVA